MSCSDDMTNIHGDTFSYTNVKTSNVCMQTCIDDCYLFMSFTFVSVTLKRYL